MKQTSNTKLDDAYGFIRNILREFLFQDLIMAKTLRLNDKIGRSQFGQHYLVKKISAISYYLGRPDFRPTFIEDEGLTLNRLYNHDETGLLWKALSSKTLASSNEDTQPGFKTSKKETLFNCNW